MADHMRDAISKLLDVYDARRRSDLPRLRESVPGLRQSLILPGCGHWTQQERPAEVNAALLDFLRGHAGLGR